jgi:hypothetical protein
LLDLVTWADQRRPGRAYFLLLFADFRRRGVAVLAIPVSSGVILLYEAESTSSISRAKADPSCRERLPYLELEE